jgi:hypothetical protein
MTTLNQKIEELGTARRKRIETRAATLIAEENDSAGTPGPQSDSNADGESLQSRSGLSAGIENSLSKRPKHS